MRFGVRCEDGLLRREAGGPRGITLPRGLSPVRVAVNRCEAMFVKEQSPEAEIGFVSELCHIPPTPWAHTVIYDGTLAHIDVAESR